MNSFENVITLIIISAFFILSIYGIGYGSAEARYRKKVDSAVNEKLKKEKSDLALERGRLQVQSQNLQSKTVSLESRMQILDKKEKDISVQVQQVSEDLRIIEKKKNALKKYNRMIHNLARGSLSFMLTLNIFMTKKPLLHFLKNLILLLKRHRMFLELLRRSESSEKKTNF